MPGDGRQGQTEPEIGRDTDENRLALTNFSTASVKAISTNLKANRKYMLLSVRPSYTKCGAYDGNITL